MCASKKIIAVILSLITLLSLISCEVDREYDEDEVITAARELVERSYSVNELLWGEGLEFGEDGVGVYKAATSDSLKKYGIDSVEDMKNKVREVYSSSYSEKIFTSDIFTSVKIDNVIKGYARYSQKYGENDEPTELLVRTDYDFSLKGSYVYKDVFEVVDVEGEIIVISATVTATSHTGKTKDISCELRLIEEQSGWRLVSPSYVVYNEYTDIYEDLNK